MPNNGFVNLHNHSDYSLLDGYSHPGEYLKRAADLGQSAVGLTDHGNLFGAFEFIKAARGMSKSYDRKNHPQTPVFVKPIVGIEAYMAPQNPEGANCKHPVFYSPELNEIIARKAEQKGRGKQPMSQRERDLRDIDVSSRGAYTHLTLFAINDEGFHNLIHLSTNANRREHFYQHGRMDFDMLRKWNEGVIATTGCPSGEIQTRLRLGQVQEAYDYAERMAELFDGRYYVEVMLHNMDKDLERDAIPKLLKLAKDLHLPLLATNDSHYALPEDARVHEEMLCINARKGDNTVTMDCLPYDDPRPDIPLVDTQGNPVVHRGVPVMKPRRFAFSGNDYYLKTYDEMIKAFPDDEFPNAVSNTVAIADMVGDWWTKPNALEVQALEEKYASSLNGTIDTDKVQDGEFTLPHATGGRTSIITVANKGITAIGKTPEDFDGNTRFEVDELSQKLIDDGTIAIGPYDMSLNTDLRPEIAIPEGWTEEDWFRKKIDEGFIQRRVAVGDSDEILAESKRRIADEYDVFAGKNFIQYMLVVQDYINWAREHGVAVGEGRGSVGGSEIAYLMDISRTDPVRHDLIFERFLNPERNSPPDVDTDFQSSGMLKVLQYVKDKYGYDHVANIITFGTFQFKQAFTDMAKIYNFKLDEIDRVKKLVPGPIERTEPTMEDLFDPDSPFYDAAAEFRDAVSTDAWKPIIQSTSKMVGRVRNTGTHACGVIISSKPIEDYAPLTWNSSEEAAKKNIWTDVQVGWEYPDLEALGLIKMDFLRLNELDIIDGAIDNITSYDETINAMLTDLESNHADNHEIDEMKHKRLRVPKLDNIETHGLYDKKTFDMLAQGDSDAVFQLSSDGMKPLLQRVNPDSFEDLVAINALYRPGPMGQNAHLEYADRKNGAKPAYIINEKLHKVFTGTPVEDILRPTYMLMVYQEQIMQISRKLAGFTRGQADSLRKAMGHKIPEEMEANHKRFIDGALAMKEKCGYSYTESDLEELWKYIEIFSAYSFNRSHSVSYAINAYKTAYLKANYRPFFMASVLTAELDNRDKIRQLIKNVEESGLKVGPVTVNRSGVGVQAAYVQHEGDADIVFGFDTVRGVNSAQAHKIVESRNKNGGSFKSFDDFMMAIPSKIVTSAGLTGLAKAGAFDEFGIPRKAIAEQAKAITEFYDKKRKLYRKARNSLLGILMDSGEGNFDALGEYDFELTGKPTIDDWSAREKLVHEQEAVGIALSGSPISNAGDGLTMWKNVPYYWRAVGLDDTIKKTANVTKWSRTSIRVVGWFTSLEYKISRKGTGWFRGEFTDGMSSVPVSVHGNAITAFITSLGLDSNQMTNMESLLSESTLYDVDLEVSTGSSGTWWKIVRITEIPTTWDGRVPLIVQSSIPEKLVSARTKKLLQELTSHKGNTPVVIDLKELPKDSKIRKAYGMSLQEGPNNVLPVEIDLNPDRVKTMQDDPLFNFEWFTTWNMHDSCENRDPAHT